MDTIKTKIIEFVKTNKVAVIAFAVGVIVGVWLF